jgi:peptide/nickel transport system substrate-binding protein
MVKALLLLFSIILLLGCQQETSHDLKVLIDPKPASLHPRNSLDATSQHLNALIFRSLVKFDPKFNLLPDLAEKWEFADGGKKIRFQMKKNLSDHQQSAITSEKMARCLENYRVGRPVSPFASSFPAWKGTKSNSESVTIELEHPDPYFLNNVTLLKYFTSTETSEPCPTEVENSSLIGNGAYFYPSTYVDQNEVSLKPFISNVMPLRFFFIIDDINKMLKMIRNEVDIAINVLSVSQREWFEKRYSDKFHFLDNAGTKVSYLSFNLKDPILSNQRVRKAIALAIPRQEMVKYKHKGIASVAQSLLSPLLKEPGDSSEIPYDPKQSELLLDEAGFPKKGKYRFSLKYKTTPAREGIETAKIFQNHLDQIGIQMIVEVVEPSTYFASLRKRNFQLASPRWLGIKDGSILYKTLHSQQPSNRSGYANAEVDKALEQLMIEPDLNKRKALILKIEKHVRQDFPYLPLFFWTNTLIYKKELKGISLDDIPLSGSLEPLLLLRK